MSENDPVIDFKPSEELAEVKVNANGNGNNNKSTDAADTMADINSITNSVSKLMLAARDGNWVDLFNILDNEASNYEFFTEDVDPANGRTILHYACEKSKRKISF